MTMGSAVLDVRGDARPDLSAAVAHVERGGVLAYPTETVYGLGGLCTPRAVDAVRSLKGRASHKPLITLVPSMEAVEDLAWTDEARELASIFWPGSVTLVLADPAGRFPPGVRSERGAVAVRVSPHPVVTGLMTSLGRPLTSTSLNVPGVPPASSGRQAREVLRELDGDDVLLVDSGTLPPSAPSTVIDCTAASPSVLREGAIPLRRLRCVIPEIHGERDR